MRDSVEFCGGDVQVEAEILGRGLGVPPGLVQPLIREGRITTMFERGTDEDEGRFRLTFFHGNRRFRFIADRDGRIIQRGSVDFGDRPLPPAMRR